MKTSFTSRIDATAAATAAMATQVVATVASWCLQLRGFWAPQSPFQEKEALPCKRASVSADPV